MILVKNMEPGKVYYNEFAKMSFLVVKKENNLKHSCGFIRFSLLWLTGISKGVISSTDLFSEYPYDHIAEIKIE